MRLASLVLLLLGSCGSSPGPAVVPILGDAAEPDMTVRGTVEAIRFQNINKAQGHYTFNVEVLVAHDGLRESPVDEDHRPGTFHVRVHKLYWERLAADERARLAPDGPEHLATVEAWKGYEVGEPVELQVVSWGRGHGAPVRR